MRDIDCPLCKNKMIMTDDKWADERTGKDYDEYFCEDCLTFVEIPMDGDE